jgi:hypothetical protein
MDGCCNINIDVNTKLYKLAYYTDRIVYVLKLILTLDSGEKEVTYHLLSQEK